MRKMSNRPLTAPALALALGLAVTLTGCSSENDEPNSSTSGPASASATEQVLADYDLEGMDTVEVIDYLDRLGGKDRPTDLMASVRPSELLLTSGDEEVALDVPEDTFYLSVAPYVDQTHECFNHSLTTCTGELSAEEIEVEIVDEAGDEVLVDETRTTFDNGFTGFWLPRDIEGTLRVTYDGKTGEVDFATGDDDPTCLTTLQLA
ncbi:CueP family metal-binding protein [Nocardioides pacificus]